jgi:hypothetical protein
LKILKMALFIGLGLLAGCQQYTTNIDSYGNLKDSQNFSFEGQVWEISQRIEEKALIGSGITYLALVKRPELPLQDNEIDKASALRASAHYMRPVMNCRPGTSPQPVVVAAARSSRNLSASAAAGVVVMWLACYTS